MTSHERLGVSFRRPLDCWSKPCWRHQMEAFSALQAICAGNSPVPVNSPHKGQWRGALMFSLISAWMNSWVNNGEAGDLRRNRAHYDVIVMRFPLTGPVCRKCDHVITSPLGQCCLNSLNCKIMHGNSDEFTQTLNIDFFLELDWSVSGVPFQHCARHFIIIL